MSCPQYPITVPFGRRFQELTGVGETKQRELDAAGEIETVVAGGRRLILVASFLSYIERQKAKPPQDARRNRAGAIPVRGTRAALTKTAGAANPK
jgi:hypothetical protein